MITKFRLPSLVLLCVIGLNACSKDRTQQGSFTNVHAAAIANEDRLAGDRADDAFRKPGKVLKFSGIGPGMTVFEMEAGSGYYTELLSHIVGPEGKVIMQNPASFDSFVGDDVKTRLLNNRLRNVVLSKTNFDKLDATDNSIDVVTWILGPHELYYKYNGESLGDADQTYAQIMRILKPGGTFIVLDHAAPDGAASTTGGTTHRIDPAIVKASAGKNGFELIEQSHALRNADDNREMQVFDPSIRRQTDRFLLKYKKPE